MFSSSFMQRSVSKARKLWTKHYDKMGLAYNKREKMVHKKIEALKIPPGCNKTLDELYPWFEGGY